MRALFLFALLGCFALPAHALRCNDRIVTTNDHAFEVRQKCGAPYWVEPFDEILVLGENSPLEQRVQRKVEAWYYNFGPNALMRRLLFRDNRLVKEETIGYGYTELGTECELGALVPGLSTGEVVARCGQPVDRDVRYQERILRNHVGMAQRRILRMDEWLYPAGSRDPYLLRFYDGKLDAVERIDR